MEGVAGPRHPRLGPRDRRGARAVAPRGPKEWTLSRRLTVGFKDYEGLRALCGERDVNLRWLEERLGIQVLARGTELTLQGPEDAVTAAAEVLSALFARARAGGTVDPEAMRRLVDARHLRAVPTEADLAHVTEGEATPGDLRHLPPGADKLRNTATHRSRALVRSLDEPELGEGTRAVSARTPGQRRYAQAIRDHEVVFGIGPAGTGKTYLAVAAALSALHRREVRRIVLTRPAVEAGEHLGFLPGDLTDKVSPYLRPLYDAVRDLVDDEAVRRMTERNQIEVAPLAFMRGRTLANSFVILDEAQNCTVEQMLMLLTRMGEHTRMVVTGDPTQTDLKGQASGLTHAVRVLQNVPGLAIVRLEIEDVVRHPLVGRIIAAWEADRAEREPALGEAPEPAVVRAGPRKARPDLR